MLQALRLLLLVALVMRGLVPVGFMPGTAPDGAGLSIVICTAEGSRTLLVDADGEHHPSDGEREICVFGVAHAGAQNLAPDLESSAFIRLAPSASDALFASQVAGWHTSMRQAPFAKPRAPPPTTSTLV